MQNPHDLSHQPFRRPVLQGRLRRKYLALALLWLIAAVFFWQWWLRPDHYTSWYLYFSCARSMPLAASPRWGRIGWRWL